MPYITASLTEIPLPNGAMIDLAGELALRQELRFTSVVEPTAYFPGPIEYEFERGRWAALNPHFDVILYRAADAALETQGDVDAAFDEHVSCEWSSFSATRYAAE